jgi:hypothetical protein
MKIILSLLVLIILSVASYAAFQLIIFEPKVPAPLVFDDAVDPTMVSESVVSETNSLPLTPQQEEQSKKAINKISDIIIEIKAFEDKVPVAAKSTMEILSGAMSTVRLPAYLLSATVDASQKRTQQKLSFDISTIQSAETLGIDNIVCELNGGAISAMLLGSDTNNSITCTQNDASKNIDQLFIGGSGDDTISDSFGNRVVNGGGGNDTIQLGSGRSIVVIDEGWGQDKITFDCAGASVSEAQKPANNDIPWTSSFINFVVVSPKLSMSDLEWDGLTLKRKGSADTLTVNEKCFTLITQN